MKEDEGRYENLIGYVRCVFIIRIFELVIVVVSVIWIILELLVSNKFVDFYIVSRYLLIDMG